MRRQPLRRAVRVSPRPRSTRLFVRGLVILAAILLPLGAALPQTPNLDAVLRGISAERLRGHIAFLADDLLEGRGPGTRGGRIAARYIAAQFERAGLQPAPGGWDQPVPLVGWRPAPERITLELDTRGRRIPLRYPDDAILWTVSGAAEAGISGELVFVGYGVEAPEFDWDDFGDADLRGKVLLFLAGDPPSPPDEPDRFDGLAMTWHGRWNAKLEQAARRGAAAALLIHTDQGAGYSWNVVRGSWTGEQFFPATRDTTIAPPAAIEGWIRSESVRFALRAAGGDLDQLIARAGRRDFAPMSTGLAVRARVAGTSRRLSTGNVVGVLPGRDPALRDQSVLFTAHYDHLGIGPAENGDSIYNGAYDNASGVALLLEMAFAYGRLQPRPPRTLVFIATAAEEAGLFGASHFVTQPVVPLDRIAAVLNLDGANLWGETWDIAAIGAERSTLGPLAEHRARALGLRLSPERAPEKGFFFRSDHFPFARAGVPALSIEHGLDYRNRPPGWGAATLARFETEHYHRPSDGFDPTADLSGAVQQARYAFLLGLDIAHVDSLPRYTDGSAFERVRERVVR